MSIFSKPLLAIKARPKAFGAITVLNDGNRPELKQMITDAGSITSWFIRSIDSSFPDSYYVTQYELESDYELLAEAPGFLIVEKKR